MDFQGIAAIIFILGLCIFIYIKRKSLILQKIAFPALYLILYKTKAGLRFMDTVSGKITKTVKFFGYCAILIGFLGMAVIWYSLLQNVYKLFSVGNAPAGVTLVLPFKVPGASFVPFFYWILSIFVIALLHEFSHGVVARAHNIKIKSSGFAFLGVLLPILPAAFVEPDEEQIEKVPEKHKLSIFAAGPFSNIVLAFIVLGIFLLAMAPITNKIYDYDGVLIEGVMDGDYPAQKAGVKNGEVIKEIDGIGIVYESNFSSYMSTKKPGDIVNIKTDKGVYELSLAQNPENKEKGYLGVFVSQNKHFKQAVTDKYGSLTIEAWIWLVGLAYWIFVLNLGIGLFNLLPLGILDGGKMVQAVLYTHMPKHAKTTWKVISTLTLLILFVNIAMAFL